MPQNQFSINMASLNCNSGCIRYFPVVGTFFTADSFYFELLVNDVFPIVLNIR